MAFQRAKFGHFYTLIQEAQNSHPEWRGIAENFVLEERLTDAREDGYGENVAASRSLGDWQMSHENYLAQKINTPQGTLPETFGAFNEPNLLSTIEQDQFLVRLEHLAWPCQLIGLAENEMIDKLNQFLKKPDDKAAGAPIYMIESLLAEWNLRRDARPIFVGFWGEVKDLFIGPSGNEIADEHWPNRLRDRFGLGHYDPEAKAPIPVLLLRYRVRDVIDAATEEDNSLAIPTVLDGKSSPYFCPTPIKGWQEGQTLNLTAGAANEYAFNREIIHRFIKYTGAYFYRAGWITQSPGKTCEEARAIHYQWLSDDFKNFGALSR